MFFENVTIKKRRGISIIHSSSPSNPIFEVLKMTNEIVEKACSKCKEVKPITSFHVAENVRSGYRAQCKRCRYEVFKRRAKFFTVEYRRQRFLWRMYGLTLENYDNLLQQQDRKCGICRKPHDTRTGKGLRVDHDHITYRVRGLLCDPCNSALGRLGDSIESIERVLKYLYQAENLPIYKKRDLRHHPNKQSHEFTPRGEIHGNAKLTAEQVKEIRQRYINNESQASLTKIFNVSQSTLSMIILRKSWKHVE